MTNLKFLKVLNPILVIDFLVVIIAVSIYKYPLFPSLQGSEMIYKIHEIAGIIFFLLGILHLILNWNWVKSQIFGIKPKSKARKSKLQIIH